MSLYGVGASLKGVSIRIVLKGWELEIFWSFETRIRELSGNNRFQLANLSPDIQVIVKRYLGSKAVWDDAILLETPNVIKPMIDAKPENLYSGLFETL